ncbi:MAG TPA: ribonuclease H-like domain-containing protein [Chitinophaga sp.]|uniref:ribonuclease H-like domain-containing protein n=1 Tax=Chitinophaga sp. TaxID=1869181 RepID=UPI002DB8484C|nr:ribonuclease H-like domain-containing protein [Chitinophaga sp.]HEU4555069.1 ribonuclease H-like domain-containing protein [Chitinophaga sp.]
MASFSELPEALQHLWMEKITKTAPETADGASDYSERAGIYAEFGKVICISAGYFTIENNRYQLRIKSIFDDDERVVLSGFLDLVNRFCARYPRFLFAGHNIKEFDIPYICRRSVIHQLSLPPCLQLHGFKPWEVPMLDTLHLWRFGDYKNYTSLKLLTTILGIPTPKDDIDGSMVAGVYWQQHDLPRIAAYCQKDVVAVGQLLQRFKGVPILKEEDIIIV